MLKYFRSLATM